MKTTGSMSRWWVAGLLLLGVASILGSMGPAAAQAPAASEAVTPVPRNDEWWQKRHASMNERVKQGNVDLLFIGDSITHGWEDPGKEVWNEYYADRNAVNLGIGGDQTQHVIWRLQNGNIDGISPKLAVIMIGTNNHRSSSAAEIADGVKTIVGILREKLPNMKILLLAIFPRTDVAQEYRDKIAQASTQFSALADKKMIFFMDIGAEFLAPDGSLPASVMPDFLHPNAVGYRIWAEAIEPKISDLMGELAAGKNPKGYETLFNGTDLTGWKGLVGDPKQRAAMNPDELAKAQAEADALMREHWKIADGALVYDGKGNSLCTGRDYEDFEMLVDWKIEKNGDSGIYLRGAPQVQIWDPAQWPQGSGGLYNNEKNPKDPLVCADNPIGEWNTFKIKMVGECVTVYLNDRLVVNKTILENYWDRSLPIYPAGQIELQHHGSTLWFKNLFIREIPRGEGWRPLFNGKDLAGWEQVGGDKPSWGVENGMLFTTGVEGGGWLATTEEFDNYELELEFRVPPGGNSGVFVRCPRTGNPAFEGSEIQVLDDYAPEYKDLKSYQYSGSVYSTAAPSRRVSRPAGEWQKYRIRCEGSRISVVFNGVPIVDVDCNDHLDKLKDHPGLKRTGGFIGLQNHGSRLDYRNIRIRKL